MFMEMTNYEHIESSVRDTLGGVVWSHKIQEKQADIYETKFKRLETAKIISSSLTSAGIVSLLFTDELWIKIVSALLSFVSIFVGAFFKSFDLRTMVVQHKKTAIVIDSFVWSAIKDWHWTKEGESSSSNYGDYELYLWQYYEQNIKGRIYLMTPGNYDIIPLQKSRECLEKVLNYMVG